ncbi:MAG: CBS domain-containing protein [Candidatus Bathyarchaeia archaeon]
MLPSLDEIVKKRKMLGLTQKQLAKLAGISQSFVAKIESGKIDPSYSKVKVIFDVLERLETKVNYTAEKILHKGVVGVQLGDAVEEAIRLMMEHGYSQLPVFNGEQVVGCITEKTVLNQVAAGKDLSQISQKAVEEIMEEAPPRIDEKAPLPLISSLLQVYPAVLVTKKGKVTGIITKADLFKVIV